jgi:hypothetical protein
MYCFSLLPTFYPLSHSALKGKRRTSKTLVVSKQQNNPKHLLAAFTCL